jgi:hypothetical protein
MFVRVALAEEHPVASAGLAGANHVRVAKGVLHLKQLDFGVPALDVRDPRLSVQDNSTRDDALGRGRNS